MKQVRLMYHQEGGSWWAESPDVPGFTAVADSEIEIRELARAGVTDFLDEPVIVIDDRRPTAAPVVEARFNTSSTNVVFLHRDAAPRSVKVDVPDLVLEA